MDENLSVRNIIGRDTALSISQTKRVKNDFYLLAKSKYDPSPWKEINHENVPLCAPDFDAGILSPADQQKLMMRQKANLERIEANLLDIDNDEIESSS